MFVFGLIGFFGGKVGLDAGAMALGVILGPMIEENLGKCFNLAQATDGGLWAVFSAGAINKALVAALVLSLATPFLLKLRGRKKDSLIPGAVPPRWYIDCLAGIGFFAFAAVFCVQFDDFEGVSRIFPESLTAILGFGGLYFMLKGIWRRFRGRPGEAGDPVAWRRVALVTGLSCIYALAIPMLGFLASTMVFIFIATMVLGQKDAGWARLARTAAIFAVGFGLAVWAAFTQLLNVPTPTGLLL